MSVSSVNLKKKIIIDCVPLSEVRRGVTAGVIIGAVMTGVGVTVSDTESTTDVVQDMSR